MDKLEIVGEPHVRKDKIEIVGEPHISRPMSYSFRFAPYGWAILTINESTGEIAINSDWGNYSHRWHVGHIGEDNLHAFFLKASAEYIVNKFSHSNKTDLADVLDPESTKKGISERIEELLAEGTIPEALAVTLREELEEWAAEDFDTHLCPSDLEANLYEPYEYLVDMPSTRSVFLTEVLIPTLKAYLREHPYAPSQPTELKSV
jgi:hypothetical protein